METKKEASFGEWCEVCPICKSDAVPFLSSLPEDQKRCLMADAVQKEFRKGSCLFEEGEAVENLIILLSGKIKMVRYDGEGREMILGIFGSGETIWEGILKEGAIFPYSGVCMTDVWACMIDRKVFVGLLGDSSVALHDDGTHSHIGITNVLRRLNMIYRKEDQENAGMLARFENRPEGGLCITIDIPLILS